MNHREIALATLERRPTPRPAAALLSGGCWTINRQGYSLQDMFGRPELLAELVIGTHVYAPSDIVWVGSGYHNLAISALGGELKYRLKGPPDVRKALLNDAGDVARLDLAGLAADLQIGTLLAATTLVQNAIGGLVLVGGSQWGPFTLTGHLLGVERVMRSIIKHPEEVHRVLRFAVELTVEYLSLFHRAGAEVVSIAEPSASGNLISRDQFRDFALPYLSAAIRQLHERGAKVVVHICGNVTNRLDLLADSGADLLSVDYKVDLREVRRHLNGKTAFSGNLNPVAIMQQATPAQVEQAALDALAAAGPEPGYMLMPGCDIPPAVPLENIRTLFRVAQQYRR